MTAHSRIKLTSLLLVVTMTAPLPLSGLVVYAQDAGNPTDELVDPDHGAEFAISLADLPVVTDLGTNPETPLTRTFTEVTDYTLLPNQTASDAMKDNPFVSTLGADSGAATADGKIFVEPDPVDLVLLGVMSTDGSAADPGAVPAGRAGYDADATSDAGGETQTFGSVPTDAAPTRATVSSEAAIAAFIKQGRGHSKPLITDYTNTLDSTLSTFISSDIRLSISQTDKTALTGENHGDCSTWNETDDDFFANGFCDPPRVSREVIHTLNYLLTPKDQGGAGREYLKVDHIIDYQTNSKEEDSEEKSVFGGLNGPHYVDFTIKPQQITDANGVKQYTFNANQQVAFSHAVDISAIDRIRITTRIQKKGIFSTSTKYRFNKPIPIKVAWQSDSGIAKEPLPTISTQELIPQLGVESILDMLGESDALEDPSFAGRPLESIGLADIARFLGGRLLGQLMNGQDIGRFNFGDTIKDFGILAISGALNLDPEVVRNAHSLEELEELTGRSWVSQQINLPSPIQGKTLNEALTDIGRQRLGELLGVKGYALTNYSSVDEFKIRLGQGLIEERLPVTEHSFEKATKDEVRQAVGAGRFDLIFKEEQASEIDERLGIEVGPTLSFIHTGNVTEYKRQIGSDLFDRTIGKYNISQGADATPLHPYQLYEQLMSDGTAVGVNGAQGVGTLRHVNDTLGEMLNAGTTYGASILNSLPPEASETGASQSLFTEKMNEVRSKVGQIITDFEPWSQIPGNSCQGQTPTNTGFGFSCQLSRSGEKYYTTPEAAIAARNAFQAAYGSIYTLISDAIAETNDLALKVETTNATNWRSLYPDLTSTTAAGDSADPLSSIGASLPKSNSILSPNDLFGTSGGANPVVALKGIASELDSARKAMQSYQGTYGSGNPVGYESANRRDQYFNFPPGTLYSAIGGQTEEAAFADIGVWTLSQRLTNQDEQVAFRTAVNNARLRTADTGTPTFTPSSAEQQYLADVFLTVRPADEFRRIGRSQLVDRLKNSAEASSVTTQANGLAVVQDVLFYTQRLQAINAGVETIRQAASDLHTTAGNEIAGLSTQLNSLLNPSSFTGISSTAISRVVREKKNLLSQLRNAVQENTTLTDVNSRILPALRNIERATMEILEGKELDYKSGIPSDISSGITSKLGGNTQIGGSCDQPDNGLLTTAKKVLGNNKFTDIFGGDDLVLNSLTSVAMSGGSNLDDTLRYLGSAKLGDLLELPQATFDVFFSPGISQTNVDDFFYSVGIGDIMARCEGATETTRDEAIKAGKDYIVHTSIPALANKLGITMPDWLQPEDIAGLVLGNPSDVLFGIGARQVEERLDFPSGFIKSVVKPEGATEAERQHNRERSIVQAALMKLDIELPLPAGFTLTDNPVQSMGQARLEEALNLPSGTFYFDPSEMYPEREAIVTHLITYYRDQYLKEKYNATLANSTAEVSARERFINAFGIGLDEDGRTLQQETQKAFNTWQTSTADKKPAAATALQTAQTAYLANLTETISLVFTGQAPKGFTSDDQQTHDDAASRLAFFEAHLDYLDQALGVPGRSGAAFGTTHKWLTAQSGMTTKKYIESTGSGSVELLATSGLAAGLRRLGVEGHWFDVITQTSNINLLRTVLKSDHAPNPTQWSELYTMFSDMFSVNLDEELNFDGGTVASIIAHPSFADEILVDQGVRLFTDKVLGINLSSTDYNRTINIKRVVQASMYGAFMNPATGRFEPYTFDNGLRLNGDMAVVYALGELNDISLQYLTTAIRGEGGTGGGNEDLWRFLRVPITFIHDAFEGRLETKGLKSGYMQEASSARQAWNDHNGDPTNQQRVIFTADAHRLTAAASGYQPSFGGENPNDNVWQDLGSIIQTGTTVAPNGATQNQSLINAQSSADPSAPDQPVNPAASPGMGSYYPWPDSVNNGTDAALNNMKTAQNNQKALDLQRTTFKDAATYVAKELGYAAMDFGIEKLFDFQAGIISPGISRALIEGNPQQRMNAIFYIGAKYALQNFTEDIPDWLRPFADFDTIKQAASFVLNLDQSAASVQAAFAPGGLFSKIQTSVFPHGLFGELNLPEGTFGAITGLMITGSTADFTVNGAAFQGLGTLFNTQSLLHIGFDFTEKWLDIDAGTLWAAYNNVYQLYKAYDAYQVFSKLQGTAAGIISLAGSSPEVAHLLQNEVNNLTALAPPGVTPDQIQTTAASNVANSGNQTVQAAQQAKAAQLQANLIQAGVTLALFAIGQIFGKAISKFETALGLPPGTIMQMIGLAATAAIQLVIVGALGPMFWVGLGIFVLMTLFGFGVTKIRVYATADGYYPFVGKLGEGSPADPGGQPPYAQWPSADILDSSGQLRTTSITGVGCNVITPSGPDNRALKERPSDCQLGWFDPQNKQSQKDNFQYASRAKVMGLVRDLYAGEYSSGVLPESDRVMWSENDYPTLVFLDQINEGSEGDYYLGASNPYLQPARIAFNRFSWTKGGENGFASPSQSATITCSASGSQWGICTNSSFWKAVHIQW